MQSPELRDRGLTRVRRLTISLGGGALIVTGVLAGWFGRPQPTSASTISDPVTEGTQGPSTIAPSTQPSSTSPSTEPSAVPSTGGSQSDVRPQTPSTTIPSTVPSTLAPSRPVSPPVQPPRPSRRRPSAGSGGS